jgi:ankyrin repeat protein
MLAGNLELVQCLIDLGAELYFSSPSGQVFNAALTAVFSGREDVLALILKNGGGLHVNAPGSDLSCLALAVKRGNYELIDQLAAAGAFVDRESGEKNLAPLHIAAMGRSESIEKLLRLGAKIEKRQSPSGMTALHYAVSDRNYGAVACLLKQGADPNALTAEGMSPLMLSDSPSITSLLITAKADVNYRRGTGTKETALHIAAARDESDMVLALLKAGADPLLTNAFNQTAGRLARESGNRYVAGRLEDAERQAEREVFEKAFKKFKRQ